MADSIVHFGSYIIHDDPARRKFAMLLSVKARAGVAVRLLFVAHGDAVAFAHVADRAAEAVDDVHRFVAEREVPPIAPSTVCTSDVQTSGGGLHHGATPVPPGSGIGFSAIPTSPIVDMTNALSVAVVPTPRASTVEAGPGRVPAARPARYQSAPRTRG